MPAHRSLGLDRSKVVALLQLRFRTTVRRITSERGRMLGGILLVVMLGPLAVGMAIATAVGYQQLPHVVAAQLLGAVLTGLWLLWIVAPILTFRVNEGLDITRLLVYPISQRDLTASLLLGTLLDLPTYLALPLFAAVLVGWSRGAAAVVVVVAALFAYAHMVLAGQIVVAGAGGLLKSRRFRDVMIVVFSLLGSSCYLIQRGAFELGSRYVDPEDLVGVRIMPVLQWLPPGASARAIERAVAGAWPESLFWLGYGAVLLAAVAWIWWRLLVRLTTGGGFPVLGLPQAERGEAPVREQSTAIPVLLRWLPSDVAVMMVKELRSVWRTPRRRVMFIQSLLMPLIFGGFALMRGDRPDTVPPWAGFGLAGYAFLASWGTCQNMLGYEGTGLPTLLLTPAPRDRVMLGKGMALALLTCSAVLVLGLGVVALVPTWTSVVGLLLALAVPLVAAGVGAVASVKFPWPIDLESTQRRSVFSTGGGCSTALANMFLLPASSGILFVPPLAVAAAAVLLDRNVAALAVGGVAIAYGGLVLWMGTRFAGAALVTREPEVIAATRLAK